MDFLKRSVLEKEVEAEQLEQQLESRRRVAEDDAEALRLQLAHLRTQLQDRTAGLQAENASLGETQAPPPGKWNKRGVLHSCDRILTDVN